MDRKIAASALALCLLAGPALAHPHVWTEMRSTLMVNGENLITGISVEWTFDEGYSGFALEGLDLNKDGTYDAEEIRPLTEENIGSLKESVYFGFLRQSEHLLKHGPVTEYAQTHKDGRLTLFFVLPLEAPVDPRKGVFDYKIYDPDFFIAFDYQKTDPVDVEGTLPAGCTSELKPPLTDDELAQKRDFLATKDLNWQNDTGEDFGSIFAQPVVVTCGP